MPDKRELFDSLKPETVFTEKIYKRLYDPEYLPRVAEKLAQIGRQDAIQGYNEWFQEWKAVDDVMMNEVSEWYLKECQRAREKRGEEEEWERKRIRLLTRKKRLLKSLRSTEN